MDTSAASLRSKLEALAKNLWWCWQPDVQELFRALDPDLWNRSNHNPVSFLKAVPDQRLVETVSAVHTLMAKAIAVRYPGFINTFIVAWNHALKRAA